MLAYLPAREPFARLLRGLIGGRTVLAAALALSLAGIPAAARPASAAVLHPPVVIDDFAVAQGELRAGPSGVGDTESAQSTATGASILGGARGLRITGTGNGFISTYVGDAIFACVGCSSYANGGPDEFETFSQTGVDGTVAITYDGTGHDPGTLAPTGLGGVDLTSGGVRNALRLDYPYYNYGVSSIVVTVYTDATHASRISFAPQFTGNGPANPPYDAILKFSDFAPVSSLAANFTNVGAITITFNTGGGMGPYFSLFRTTDTIPPVLSLPGNISEPAISANGAPATFAASAADAADGAVTPSCDHGSGDTFPIGPTVVHCTATDSEGNTSAGSFTVTIGPLVATATATATQTVTATPTATGTATGAATGTPTGTATATSTPVDSSGGGGTGTGGGAATPEVGSGGLLATALVPIGIVLLYRRRRARRAGEGREA